MTKRISKPATPLPKAPKELQEALKRNQALEREGTRNADNPQKVALSRAQQLEREALGLSVRRH